MADIAGYTRLVEADTKGTVAAWQACRDDMVEPVIAEFGGKVVKLAGDGFLAEFSSVQNAVAAALHELGRLEEMDDRVEQLKSQFPEFALAGWAFLGLIADPDLRQQTLTKMKKVGIPEG